MMILAASHLSHLPPLSKHIINIKSFPFLQSPLSFTKLKSRKSNATFCSKEKNAHNLFDGFSILSTNTIPWDSGNIWSTFGAYFFILHIPLSFGGLSITCKILHQPELDPQTMAFTALILQTLETIAATALLQHTAKPQCKVSQYIKGASFDNRSWMKASALGFGFLIGFVWITSYVADMFIAPKLQDVNNPILKDMLTYSPASRTACFLLYCFIAPLLEEIMYRGFLLSCLIASENKWWQAVIISSSVFSVTHFSGENLIQLFLIGSVLGSVYCWTGNLVAPFTVHSLYSATILLVMAMSQNGY